MRRALGLASLLLLAACPAVAPAAAAPGGKRPLPVPQFRLFDVGVIDFDGDGDLDVHSSAHSFANGLLENRPGKRRFADVTDRAGFQVSPGFPGLEDFRPPRPAKDGLYAYQLRPKRSSKSTSVVLRAEGTAVTGEMVLDPGRGLFLRRSHHGRIRILEKSFEVKEGVRHRQVERLRFDLHPEGRVVIDTTIQAPVTVKVAGGVRSFVGSKAKPVEGARFPLWTPDIHANVSFDIDRDGDEDLFRATGGLGGKVTRPGMAESTSDLAYLKDPGGYEPVDLGLRKDGCRSRSAATVDANADGRADIFIACEDSRPRLHIQTPSGWRVQRVPAHGDVFRWVQLGESPRPALLALGSKASVYRLRGGRWQRTQTLPLFRPAEHAAIDDPDGDGDVDVFVSSAHGSTLLTSHGDGSLSRRRPGSVGLPGRASVSAWVDANGDGRADLHTLSRGLYLQRRNGSFERTGGLRYRIPYGHLTWADFDNDGTREPLIGDSQREFTRRGKVFLAGRDRPGRPGWLWLDLPGALNTSRVVVETPRGRRQTAWAGESETSRHSDTHHRIYFTGLGRARTARVRITSPTGRLRTMRVATNRVVELGGM